VVGKTNLRFKLNLQSNPFKVNKISIVASVLIGIQLTLLSYSSNAQSVFSDHDTKADFKKYKTYAWMAPGDTVLNGKRKDKLYAGYIMYAANLELKNKGMKIDTIQPDAIFIFSTTVEEKIEYSQSPTLSVGVGVAGPGYYVASSAPIAGGEITEKQMEEGVLSYNMYDAKTHALIWNGGVEKRFSASMDDVEALIGEYTKKIFKKLPIKIK